MEKDVVKSFLTSIFYSFFFFFVKCAFSFFFFEVLNNFLKIFILRHWFVQSQSLAKCVVVQTPRKKG